MTPDVVVDVGNSRIKWGRVDDRRVTEMVAFDPDDAAGWERRAYLWGLSSSARWVVAGVNPPAMSRLQEWLVGRGFTCRTVTSPDVAALPGFYTAVDEPSKAGVDRLLGALAAGRMKPSDAPAVVVQVGTAMTVDFVRPDGEHAGGAILPGPRLMAESLHRHTAKLPPVEVPAQRPDYPFGTNTTSAIQLGIASAVLGTTDQLLWHWAYICGQRRPAVYLTGGAVGFFRGFTFTADTSGVIFAPYLVLDGLVLAAEALP